MARGGATGFAAGAFGFFASAFLGFFAFGIFGGSHAVGKSKPASPVVVAAALLEPDAAGLSVPVDIDMDANTGLGVTDALGVADANAVTAAAALRAAKRKAANLLKGDIVDTETGMMAVAVASMDEVDVLEVWGSAVTGQVSKVRCVVIVVGVAPVELFPGVQVAGDRELAALRAMAGGVEPGVTLRAIAGGVPVALATIPSRAQSAV
ncbi:hypothetical protein C8J57DRAFT_1528250 [Mycena rebaudengoi]|nr:hypothetical protein C8J57DRAFT_1528250 [Mycena rebaudengoi]